MSSSVAARLRKAKVTELRAECSKLGLSEIGIKAELIERLEQHYATPSTSQTNSATLNANEVVAHSEPSSKSPIVEVAEIQDKLRDSVSTTAPTKAQSTQGSDIEARKQRALRFGLPLSGLNEEEKKLQREKRFGPTIAIEKQKKQKTNNK